jgi:hypothetical protein
MSSRNEEQMGMKRNLILLLALTACVVGLSACGWKAPCAAAPLTAPWDKMNLPVQKDAAVCVSSADKLQAAHKGDKAEVSKMYLDALDKGGWKVTKRDLGAAYNYDFEKGPDKISLEVYDWQKTGVIIRKR